MSESHKFKAACLQNCAVADMDASIEQADALLSEAHDAGVQLACLPEFFSCFDVRQRVLQVGIFSEQEHPAITHFAARAKALSMWVLLGSVAVVDAPAERPRNRSILIDTHGDIVSRYDKIHMFDVDLPDGEVYRESATFMRGDKAVMARTPWGMLGMTVCYDVRFAHLYRTLAQSGAGLISVPAAFTATTGKAHWHTLLRARAIETGSFVIAPCQYGRHGDARSFGHSLIVGPWGEILSDAGEGVGLAVADIDTRKIEQARRRIPALEHDKHFDLPGTVARLTGT